ncbi:hypothetical protein B566_EDAN004426 [Ephemera danica]|nr:hypothetical protein B566_EDAN004426 [Ephemera danica]
MQHHHQQRPPSVEPERESNTPSRNRVLDITAHVETDDAAGTRTKQDTKKHHPHPDGGWGWVIVACSLAISLIQDGVSFSFGLIYVELLRDFGASMSKTSWVGALFLAVPLLAGPLASAMVERYGCRLMTIAGFGLAIGYVTAVVSVAYWFDKRISLANGIGVSGTGIGTFLFAPFTQWSINEFGWRGTSILLAGAFLHMCVCGAAMRDPDWLVQEKRQATINKTEKSTAFTDVLDQVKSHEGANAVAPLLVRQISNSQLPELALHESYLNHHRRSLTHRGALVRCAQPERYVASASCPDLLQVSVQFWPEHSPPKEQTSPPNSLLSELAQPRFVLLCASTLLLYTWFIVPYLYLAEHMLRHGYVDTDTSSVLAVIGILNTVAMVGLGWAGDKPWLPVAKTYGACLLVSGVSTMAMPPLVRAHSHVGLATAAALFGLSLASNYSFTPLLVLQIVGLERFTPAFGVVLLVQGIGNLVGPPLAGWVFDVTGTWDLSFYLAGVFLAISGLLALLIALYQQH